MPSTLYLKAEWMSPVFLYHQDFSIGRFRKQLYIGNLASDSFIDLYGKVWDISTAPCQWRDDLVVGKAVKRF